MTRYIIKRLGLALITLVLLSMIVFATAQLLPGDIGRNILGPFAPQSAVDAMNHQLGADQPAVVQYWHWIKGIVHGDLGESLQYQEPIRPLLSTALGNSLKLALVAFLIVIPLGVLGGIAAGLRAGRALDRTVSVGGLSLTAVPEFVTGIVLIIVVGIFLGWLPITAQAPPGSSVLTQGKYLLLPAICIAGVLFGYIARITRAGMVEALDSEYARTAYLKGLPGNVVVRRHVLRNALLPTIAVTATQIGYLFGGLVIVETLFNYPGVGSLVFTAATKKDYPMLEAGVLVIGIVYLLVTLAADILIAFLNPRIRLSGATE